MLSRVADCLYWMSRYLERAQHTARLVDVYRDITLDQKGARALARWRLVNEELELPPLPDGAQEDPRELARWISYDLLNESSIASSVHRARENARSVRELISTEMWESINLLYHRVRQAGDGRVPAEDGGASYYKLVMDGVYLFHGHAQSTLSHNEGWQFVRLGQHIERAQMIARQLKVNFRLCSVAPSNGGPDGPADHLDWIALMKSCLALEMYCKAYSPQFEPALVAEFLLLDAKFPYSVRFCAEHIRESLDELAVQSLQPGSKRSQLLAGRLASMLSYAQVEEVMAEGIENLLARVALLCDAIHEALYAEYIHYAVEEEHQPA